MTAIQLIRWWLRGRPGLCPECRRLCLVAHGEEWRYCLGVDLVRDSGRQVAEAAAGLAICPRLLSVWVDDAQTNLRFRVEAEGGTDG